MKAELVEKIRKVAREMISNKINGVIEDMSSDDSFEEELLDSPELSDISEDDMDDIRDAIRSNEGGYIEDFHIENLIDAVTGSFMKKVEGE